MDICIAFTKNRASCILRQKIKALLIWTHLFVIVRKKILLVLSIEFMSGIIASMIGKLRVYKKQF